MTSAFKQALLLKQLRAWAAGNSYHENVLGTCVPDFSCCLPNLGIPIVEREVFLERWLAGDTDFTRKRIMEFLDALIQHIYGDGDEEFRVHYTGGSGFQHQTVTRIPVFHIKGGDLRVALFIPNKKSPYKQGEKFGEKQGDHL